MPISNNRRSSAQEARAAIERIYIAMRHLFIRGSYKPMGVSGEAINDALLTLKPEIYGTIADPERVELDGLLYIFERLPKGIEECRYINLITKEGFEHSNFEPITAPKRRRNSYRIDQEQMFIEMTRGKSDVYDILTHLTFMFIESNKIRHNSMDAKERIRREWGMLEQIVLADQDGQTFNEEVAYTYLSALLGRTFDEIADACKRFAKSKAVNSLFHITYWLGKLAMEEEENDKDREITFSSTLRQEIGHHVYGASWAHNIKQLLFEQNLIDRPIHIISSNLHSVMNVLYAKEALKYKMDVTSMEEIANELSKSGNKSLRSEVKDFAMGHGMYEIEDHSGANIGVHIFDTAKIPAKNLPSNCQPSEGLTDEQKPVILVMDYAFGEQAFETMDELLKPFNKPDNSEVCLQVQSISIMGKAGTLVGNRGTILIPNAHVFEGTADNYPFENQLHKSDFEGEGLEVIEGPMITVLGTSLQNKSMLQFFQTSSWNMVGLEMEGAHYQKAIQAASKIRKSIKEDVVIRYAYYASDNPLLTGHTLASGSLGLTGVKPTYLITMKILEGIFCG
ncbi:MAG: hypothetical protein AB8B69_01630 [Chitinophagales bacterium]